MCLARLHFRSLLLLHSDARFLALRFAFVLFHERACCALCAAVYEKVQRSIVQNTWSRAEPSGWMDNSMILSRQRCFIAPFVACLPVSPSICLPVRLADWLLPLRRLAPVRISMTRRLPVGATLDCRRSSSSSSSPRRRENGAISLVALGLEDVSAAAVWLTGWLRSGCLSLCCLSSYRRGSGGGG